MVDMLAAEAANLGYIDPRVRESVLEEFYTLCTTDPLLASGGVDYVRELLSKALGSQKAEAIIRKLMGSDRVQPLSIARRADPAQLATFLQAEHPQAIALVLSYLEPAQAAKVMASLPAEKQASVARRIALMGKPSSDTVRRVEKALEQRLAGLGVEGPSAHAGIELLIKILNKSDRSTEKTILGALERSDPALAEEVKKRIFVFEDLAKLFDKTVQRVLREPEVMKLLPMALKTASDAVKNKVFSNMSSRAAETIREEMEYLGAVRIREVEDAQQKIVTILRKLEDSGEVVLREDQEEFVK